MWHFTGFFGDSRQSLFDLTMSVGRRSNLTSSPLDISHIGLDWIVHVNVNRQTDTRLNQYSNTSELKINIYTFEKVSWIHIKCHAGHKSQSVS